MSTIEPRFEFLFKADDGEVLSMSISGDANISTVFDVFIRFLRAATYADSTIQHGLQEALDTSPT